MDCWDYDQCTGVLKLDSAGDDTLVPKIGMVPQYTIIVGVSIIRVPSLPDRLRGQRSKMVWERVYTHTTRDWFSLHYCAALRVHVP